MSLSNENEDRYVLSSVDGALKVLCLFYDHEELSTNEVARLTGMSRSTAFRFMVTLEKRGFVTKTDRSRYRLGMTMFSLGLLAYKRMELTSLIHPLLERMAEESGETCHLAVMEDDTHVLFIDRALGTSRLKMDTMPGYRQLAHCTGTGKAMLAFRTESEIGEYISRAPFTRVTEHSIKNADELLEILERVRADGYAVDNEEAERGLTCFAKPLLYESGYPYAAISVSGPTSRMQADKEAHIERLERAAEAIASMSG